LRVGGGNGKSRLRGSRRSGKHQQQQDEDHSHRSDDNRIAQLEKR
jgi:hypothetical protein